jgi:2-hydroxy-3-keto-5-methylthiopentenyl-1-phosphate phosphatase
MEITKEHIYEGDPDRYDLDWHIHVNLDELMDFILTNEEIRNSFKEWLDKQQ